MARHNESDRVVPDRATHGLGGHLLSAGTPGHRVVATNGSLRGYAGGVDRKERLLEMEGVNMAGLPTPPTADDGGGTRE